MKGGRDELVGRNGMDNWFSGLLGFGEKVMSEKVRKRRRMILGE